MSVKSAASQLLGNYMHEKLLKEAKNAITFQKKTFDQLISKSKNTLFGKDHEFQAIQNHEDFKQHVPIRDYEELAVYVNRIKQGEENILWPGLPTYFCKTSGTTSGTKYIPLTRDSIPNHIHSARNALLNYIGETKNSNFVNGKMIFLQGSPALEKLPSGIPFGRLSGIVANHVPSYLQKNRMPSFETNCIEDWETKVKQIVVETSKENMTLISGIPAWVQMYFEMLLDYTGKKTVLEVFPNFQLFPFGGVSFDPYSKRMQELIGAEIPKLELYPASEGFLAYQDSQTSEGLRLNINSGIFFEFIRADEYFSAAPTRYTLEEVELGVNYALILSNNAGLWAYSIGDTVKFVSIHPHRIVVTGRIKHFTSAFGEHVIAEEVEKAMAHAQNLFQFTAQEFHVAPQVNPDHGLPYHEWFIEFNQTCSIAELEKLLDNKMQEQNVYYRDLIEGKVLRPLKITSVRQGGFNTYMKSQGKLGGQNKIPRLANDRKIADILETE
jgi:hypothetical protein